MCQMKRCELISPYGFCEGVTRAFLIAEKAKAMHPDQRIHLIGNLVHNEELMRKMAKRGFCLVDERKTDLGEYLLGLSPNDVIVFSAHGHDPRLDEIADEKGLTVFDATCPFVKRNAMAIRQALNEGNDVIYLGVDGHAEALAALAIDQKRVHLYSEKDESVPDVFSLSPLVVSQTTMTEDELSERLMNIQKRYPGARYAARRCKATKRRQEAIEKANKDIDCFIIMGSNASNNTQKLAAVAHKSHPAAEVHICMTAKEALSLPFRCFDHLAIASGASTDAQETEQVFAALSRLVDN